MDTTKDEFIELWGQQGYEETFLRHYPYEKELSDVLDKYADKNYTVLELGCGSGLWTKKFLVPRFKNIISLDIIKYPPHLKQIESVKYIELPSNTYTCPGVDDNSIDFVWSFGLFCHLSNIAQQEYLKNICKKMKIGAKGCIMFANWDRHPTLKNVSGKDNFENNQYNTNRGGWFFSNIARTQRQIQDAGFKNFEDTIPAFRDTLAKFEK